MFNKKRKPETTMAQNNQKQLDTLIGQSTRMKGDMTFSGMMHLDGQVEGSVIAENDNDTLTISENGRVKGTIKAGNLVINGTIEGDITATGKIEVLSQARISGNIYYVNIEMETGSQINGQLIYQGGEVTHINKHDKKDKQQKHE
ncbi:bactofilin family protein [Marinicella gelatinilytica]|uniref:bactofilin family protein n=1 Tax=Marinicella gelatinilytica TaxID=2996017 RepID=UPI0022608F94|nr:polymer-forming cytoskeletal protein [Marinicella gelatinilytica]MCX7545286.1 polymer-forming cytoskeletal protein [Marinicella gelatinilytica]